MTMHSVKGCRTRRLKPDAAAGGVRWGWGPCNAGPRGSGLEQPDFNSAEQWPSGLLAG
jgi:hypothetical protein